jgi:hypothetical protein
MDVYAETAASTSDQTGGNIFRVAGVASKHGAGGGDLS